MPRSPRAIVSVSTADLGSGAERVAWDLFKGFRRRGLGSWLAVGDKKTDDPHVLPLFLNPRVDYRPYAHPRYQAALRAIKARDAARGLEDFHFPYSKYILSLTAPPPDLLLCHNLHGGYFDLRVLPELSQRLPVFLVLHDCWTLTGHCAYPVGCPRWQTGCGRCPDLSLPPAVPRDATAENWARKKAIFQGARLHVTAPTRWLLDRARRSILAPAVVDTRHIPCPVDLDVFRPGARAEARRALGLPPAGPVLVFAAHGAKENPYKDFATVRAAARLLAAQMPGAPVLFVVLGQKAPEERFGTLRLHFLPFQGRAQVARWLRAADACVHAAREENFGLTTAEALACGTPVVATAVGGLPEVIPDGECGLLVPPGDAERMARAVRRLLESPDLRDRLGEQAARYARRHYALDAVLDAYLRWFDEVLGAAPGGWGDGGRAA